MSGVPATLGTAFTVFAVFAGTNVDDVVILTVPFLSALFLSARAQGRPRPWQIVTGQFRRHRPSDRFPLIQGN